MNKKEEAIIISNKLAEKYPEFDEFDVYRISPSKKYGPTLVYFRARAKSSQSDYSNVNLDEDGNYECRVVEIKGSREGDYFKSSICDEFDADDEDANTSANLLNY